jgi:3-oxoacyl-[acyl-carrier protein] reductase
MNKDETVNFGQRFVGKTALVTGAARGIGRAVAFRLAQEGARIVVNFLRNEAAAKEVIESIRALGGDAMAVRANVAERSAVHQMVEQAEQRFGPIDVLVNNAASVHHGDLLTYSDNQLDQDLEEMWRVNVLGTIYCTRAVIPSMIRRQAGSIVNITSIAGYANASPGTTFYGATKAALVQLTKRFAFELGPHQIRVNAVAPGLTRTDILTAGRSPEQVNNLVEDFAHRSVLRRVGEPSDIAGTVAFLASPEGRFITGQVVTADGGRMDFLSFSK